MDNFIIVLIIIGAIATAVTLIRGVITMARGQDISGHKSNRLMGLRVLLQAITILLVIGLLILSRGGGN